MLFALPISYILYCFAYPPETILIVFIVVSLINNLTAQFFLKSTIGFDISDYFKRVYVGIIGVVILTIPLYFVADYFQNSLIDLLVFSIFSTLWVLGSVWLVGLTNKEKNVVSRVFKKKLKNGI
jgi:hypothetical protein